MFKEFLFFLNAEDFILLVLVFVKNGNNSFGLIFGENSFNFFARTF